MGAVMPGKTPAPAAKPGASGNGFRLESLLRPSRHSAPEAQELLSRVMLRVAEKHDDPAMRAAGERLAKVAKQRPGRSD